MQFHKIEFISIKNLKSNCKSNLSDCNLPAYKIYSTRHKNNLLNKFHKRLRKSLFRYAKLMHLFEWKLDTGFVLGKLYGMHSFVYLLKTNFHPAAFWFWSSVPTPENVPPQRKILKIELCILLKISLQHTNCAIC